MRLIVGALVGAIAAVPAALLYAAKQLVDYNKWAGVGPAGDALVSIVILLDGSVIGPLVAPFGNRIRLAEARQPDADG
ncbi:MAG: hypothetical protein F4Y35_03690 [Chloroflexi bacterium]|nr:hypothetical protein [Chloroflexota bacterium]